MLCAIWYHFYNLKNVKNTNRGVLLLVKLNQWRTVKVAGFSFKNESTASEFYLSQIVGEYVHVHELQNIFRIVKVT